MLFRSEHSAIEDIRIRLICPNGNACKIQPDYQNDGWGGISHYFRTNLGVANRLQDVASCNTSQNPMGIAWNYIWSNNTTLGYQYAPGTYGYCYEPVNVHYTYNPYWDDGTQSYKIDSRKPWPKWASGLQPDWCLTCPGPLGTR